MDLRRGSLESNTGTFGDGHFRKNHMAVLVFRSIRRSSLVVVQISGARKGVLRQGLNKASPVRPGSFNNYASVHSGTLVCRTKAGRDPEEAN